MHVKPFLSFPTLLSSSAMNICKMSPISKAMAPLEGYWCPPAPKQPGHGPPAMRTSRQRKNHWNSWKNSWNTSWFMFIIVVEFFDMVDDLTDLILIDFVRYSIDLKWLMVDVKVSKIWFFWDEFATHVPGKPRWTKNRVDRGYAIILMSSMIKYANGIETNVP